MAETFEYSLAQLAKMLEVEYRGDPETAITGLATLASAGPGQLSFYSNPRYLQELAATRAAAVIVHPDHLSHCRVNALVSDKPYLSFARASHLFSFRDPGPGRIHPSASIHPDSTVDPSAVISQNVVIEAGAEVGEGVYIGANCFVGEDCRIGEGSWIYPNVVLYANTFMGKDVIVHSGVVIGSDGFGFAHDGAGHLKIEQLGGVEIGNNVEIGAGTCIDRGALDNTVIADGVKIDNLVQIAHNVRIGRNSIICGCSGIAGSATIGENCIIAGGAGVSNHVTLADNVTITAMSVCNRDVPEKGAYSSGTALTETSLWKRNMLRFSELDSMAKQLKRIVKEQQK